MKIEIENNPLNIDLNKLLVLGNRANNEKRNFLFISKCLGKHLVVKPEIVKLIGFALAYQIYQPKNYPISDIISLLEYPYQKMSQSNDLKNIYSQKIQNKEEVLVLGFAETATGLGMSVANAIENSYYVTTTREPIISTKSCFDFEETHSHATSHQCFLEDIRKLNSETIVLVDDEITTGNTMLNLIDSLENNLPSKKRKYIIVSILDWRNYSQRNKFEIFKKEHNVNIQVKSLISGTIENNDSRFFTEEKEKTITETTEVKELNKFERKLYKTKDGDVSYITSTGRFGIGSNVFSDIEQKSYEIYKAIEEDLNIGNKKILILGHGENIYIPSRIASKFPNAEFKTTSRSPIYISTENNYPIKEKHSFMDKDIKYFFYDKSFIERYYDKVILLIETDLNIKLCNNCYIYKI